MALPRSRARRPIAGAAIVLASAALFAGTIGRPRFVPVLAARSLTFEVANNPYSTAAADLNHDGDPDVVTGTLTGTVSVLLGNGDDTLRERVDTTIEGEARSVAIADLDGDTRPDLVSVQFPAGTVTVLPGRGDGTFGAASVYPTGERPTSVAIGDLNGDGRPDLVTGNVDSTMSVLLGRADGTFPSHVDYPAAPGSAIRGVAIGDANADGHLDVVVPNPHDASVTVFLGHGDGTFGPAIDSTVNDGPSYAAIGDLNGDGVLDIVTANRVNSPAGSVSVVFGNGDGTFRAPASYDVANSLRAVVIADLDADGKPDLAATGDSSRLSILLNRGDGVFGVATPYPIHSPVSIAVADFSRDGKPDVAVSSYLGRDVSVFHGNGDGTFGHPVAVSPVAANPWSLAVGDLTGDGIPDVVTTHLFDDLLSVRIGDGHGRFAGGATYPISGSPVAVILRDFDGNGTLDLVVATQFRLSVSVLLGHGDGTFGSPTPYSTDVGGPPISLAAGDLNGDSRDDIAVGTDQSVTVLLGNGDGAFATGGAYGTTGSPSAIGLGDVNGDGEDDLVTASSRWNSVSVLIGNGDGSFQPKTDYATAPQPKSIAIGDVTGDGKLDLVVGSNFDRSVSILRGHGDGSFEPASTLAGHGGEWVALADVSHDTAVDIVAVSGNGTASAFIARAGGAFEMQGYGIGGSARAMAVADVDGDGRPDLLTAGSYPAAPDGAVSTFLNIAPDELPATLTLEPEVINLRSRARWVTAHVEIPGFDLGSLDLASVRLAGIISPEARTADIGDHDRDGVPDLMIKFRRESLDPLLSAGVDEAELTGYLATGELFRASASIRVVGHGGSSEGEASPHAPRAGL